MTQDHTFWTIWTYARNAIHAVNRSKLKDGVYASGPRYWHLAVTEAYSLHPCILRIIKKEGVRPHDWQRLLLEWPHISEDNPEQIAYTRTEEHGLDFIANGNKRQTRVALGKYLARHWPHVPDHIRRDWAGRFKPVKYEVWDTIEGIISGVELGPQSCMKSSYGSIPFNGRDNEVLCAWHSDKSNSAPQWTKHPYIVYQPEYGWRMAVLIDSGKPDVVISRCLVNINDHTFVRSYTRGNRGEADDYSYADDKLETWLKDQGFSKANSWRGRMLGVFEHPLDGIMVPYIDGGSQTATHKGDHLLICGDGELDGSNANGLGGDARESMGSCDECSDTVYEDDVYRIWVGRDEDTPVCGNCADRFTFVRGEDGSASRGFANYYVRDSNAVTVGQYAYDENNLPDCIHELHDGTYAHEDDTVYLDDEDKYYMAEDDAIVEVEGDWYLKDNDKVVQCRDDEYRMRDDCWQDDETHYWYDDTEDFCEINGNQYHSDTLKQWLIDAGQMNLDLEF